MACHSVIGKDSTQFSQTQEYIPERWLRDNMEFPSAKEAHPFAYMPFGFGPRTCIGRRFAEMELETLLLTVRKLVPAATILLPVGFSQSNNDNQISISK